LSGDLRCTIEEKNEKGEDCNRPFRHELKSSSFATKVTHYTAKRKRFFPLNLDTQHLKLYFLRGLKFTEKGQMGIRPTHIHEVSKTSDFTDFDND